MLSSELTIFVRSVDGLRKEELVSLIDEHLTKNASSLSSNATFKDYYGRTSSPTKRLPANATDGEVKVRKRRTTKIKEETDQCVPSFAVFLLSDNFLTCFAVAMLHLLHHLYQQ